MFVRSVHVRWQTTLPATLRRIGDKILEMENIELEFYDNSFQAVVRILKIGTI